MLEPPAESHTETIYIAGTGARLRAHVLRTPYTVPCVSLVAHDVTSVRVQLSRDQAIQARDELARVLLADELWDAEVGTA